MNEFHAGQRRLRWQTLSRFATMPIMMMQVSREDVERSKWTTHRRPKRGLRVGAVSLSLGSQAGVLFWVMAFSFISQLAAAPPFVPGVDRFVNTDQVDDSALGEVLITELSCTACHLTPSADLAPKPGPNLSGVGLRVSQQWLDAYLKSPQSLKPGTTMPNVLDGLDEERLSHSVAALSAFLSTQQNPPPEIKATGLNPVPFEFWKKGDAEHGKELFHRVGCVACHEPDVAFGVQVRESALDQLIRDLDPEELQAMGLGGTLQTVNSVPLGDLAAKYSKHSLTHFLLDPELARPGGRMPSLKLSAVEAADIAAYLLRDQAADPFPLLNAAPGLIEEGRELFVTLRCANCHAVQEELNPTFSKPLADLGWNASASCLEQPDRPQPLYELSGRQRTLLRETLQSVQSRPDQISVDALRSMLRLNCFACHERDGLGGVDRRRQNYFETVGHVDIGDEGRLPPSLTHVGQKLQPAWFQKVLAGSGDIRPHLSLRMPKFPVAETKLLPELFASADELVTESEAEVFGSTKELLESGRALLNTGCIQCHPLRGESLSGVVGTDLAGVTTRVQPLWFKTFLLNPVDLKSRTRMPTFFPSRRSSNQEILNGDVDLQIAAIWAYLKQIETAELPPKILDARSQSFELTPTDQPILLRTFMERAGTRAIAVGFPEQVHYAFDAERVDLAEAWRGRFLDAHGTWFDRFTPLAVPLGTDRVDLRKTVQLVAIATSRDPDEELQIQLVRPQFRGYRLDQTGVPTFLYFLGDIKLEDRIEPSADRGLIRTLQVVSQKSNREPAKLGLLVGTRLVRSDSQFARPDGLRLTISPEAILTGLSEREFDDGRNLWTLDNLDGRVITVEYEWQR